MTKKDYIAIASMFAHTLANVNLENDSHARDIARRALYHLVRQFCTHAYSDNGRFDESRFMAACNWERT